MMIVTVQSELSQLCVAGLCCEVDIRQKTKSIGNNSWMSSPGVTFNLTCGKGATEVQTLPTYVCHPLQKIIRCNRRILTSPLSFHLRAISSCGVGECDCSIGLS